MRRNKRGIAGLLIVAVCALGAPAYAAIAPYDGSEPDTAVLYHLDEAADTKSSGPDPYPVVDDAGHVPLGTDVTSPFDQVDSPDDLGTAVTSYAGWKRTFRAGDVDAKSVFSTEQFTIEAWIRDPGSPPAVDTGINTIFSVFNAGEIRFAVIEAGGEKKLSLLYNLPGGAGTAEYSSDDDAVSFEPGAWYHAAVTYDDHGSGAADDGTVTLYFTPESLFDSGPQEVGTHVGAMDLEAFAANSSGSVAIGEQYGSHYFNGTIDEVRYSNVVRALGPAIPEPGGLGLLGPVLLAFRRRRT